MCDHGPKGRSATRKIIPHGFPALWRGFRSFFFCLALAAILEIFGLPGTRESDLAHAAGGAALPPAAPVAAVYQPLDEQLEVFIVDANGALNVVWKDNNGSWKAPIPLTRASFTLPGASVAAIYYPTYQQLEVFVVDKDGALDVVWKDHNGPWHAPVGLTDRGFAPPGAPLAAVYQPLNEQLEVFVVGASGALNVVWKDNNGIWKGPLALTGAAFATPGAHVAGAYYASYKQLEVFLLDKNEVFNVVWKANNGPWHSPVGLSPLGFARQGAPLTAIYQPLNEQLEVLTVDSRGAINVIWKEHNNPWHAPVGLTGVDSVIVGSALTGIYYPPNEQLEVFFIDKLGAFNVLWKEHNTAWKGPVGVTEPHFVAGAPVAAVLYPRYDQLEAFTTDKGGVLNVEWKVRNQAWAPCSFPLMGIIPPQEIPLEVMTPTVVKTERLGQLTGNPDPENLPSLNAKGSVEWAGSGVEGVDLGANTDHNGRLFIFFGDTVPGNGPAVPGNPADVPARDTDLVGWTSDTVLRPGGFTLHPVKAGAGQYFDPFSVDSAIGTLPNGRTPTGAFSYGGRVYVFGIWDDPADPVIGTQAGKPVRLPTTVLASKNDPSRVGPYHLEFTLSKAKFWQVAPVVVKNADHPGLPEAQGDGLVLLGGGAGDAIDLAWMRLEPGRGPVMSSVRYYTGNPQQPWTPAEHDESRARAHEGEAKAVVTLPPHYTSVSAAWLPQAKQWIVVYSRAINDPVAKQDNPAGPIVARFGVNPWTWSDEVQIFNTCRDFAYGHFMHWSGIDDIPARVQPPIFGDAPGWAYGAFLMQRFTGWDAGPRELTLAYLMSTSNPYQVQVMRTRLRMPFVLAHPTGNTLLKLRNAGIDFSVPEADLRQWLSDSQTTPYPAISTALLNLLEAKRLRQPVYLDVIVWNYEHAPGVSSPRRVADVNVGRLRAAVVQGYNERYGEAASDFQALVR